MSFDRDIISAARRCQPWNPDSRKVYLCDVAAELGTTVAELAPALIALHRETGCLARADMVDAFDQDKLARSTVATGVRYGSQLLDLETIDAADRNASALAELRARKATRARP